MKIELVGKISGGQDGAIYGTEVFRFDHRGNCRVHDLRNMEEVSRRVATFVLDRADVLVPHCNAVVFGCERYEEGDEFPLLYANVYNNYASQPDKLRGVCCVYRLQRTEDSFRTTLVQLIEIGFVDDPTLWKNSEEADGVRPYGNFVIDREAGEYYAFVMRESTQHTRFFRFALPAVREGELDPTYGVPRRVLTAKDIRSYFDGPYQMFIQGATAFGGKIYSTEGFAHDEVRRPAIRVFDLRAEKEIASLDLLSNGYENEPEMIDFLRKDCYYSDANGNLYSLTL